MKYYPTFIADLYTAGFFCTTIVIILIVSEWLNRKVQLKSIITRKFVHISIGLISAFSPWYFTESLMVIIMAILLTVGNLYMLKKDILASIHRHNTHNYGTVFFPFAFLLLTIFFWKKPLLFSSGMIVMAIADPLASTIGRSVTHPRMFTLWKENKSIEGSVFMFISSFLLLSVIIIYGSWFTHHLQYLPIGVIFSLVGLVALIATAGEITSRNGSDNFSVPILIAMFLDIFIIQYNHNYLLPIVMWLFVSLAIFIFTTYKKWLTPDGCVAAWLLGLVIFSTQGLVWILPLFVFFISASVITRLRKGHSSENQTRNGRRLVQVLANGGVATGIALWSFYTKNDSGFIFYLAAIAAATADTWATEIGMRNKTKPFHCLTFKPLKPGDSGGVTILGTTGSLVGAFMIGSLGIITGLAINQILLITVAGFMGSVGDSILGGTIQAKYHCQICGKETEKSRHCNHPCRHTAGLKMFNNDAVNIINTIIAVVFVYIFM